MSIREKLRNPFVQQYALEIFLPLIGYFLLDWSLTIIAAFYIVDQFVGEILFFRKLHWINKNSGQTYNRWLLPLSILLFLILFSAESLIIIYYWQNIFSGQIETAILEIQNFAIDELWLLLPLMGYLYYLRDQFTFYMPRRYLQHKLMATFQTKLIENTGIVVLIALGLMIWNRVSVDELVVIILFMITKLSFDFVVFKWLKPRALKL